MSEEKIDYSVAEMWSNVATSLHEQFSHPSVWGRIVYALNPKKVTNEFWKRSLDLYAKFDEKVTRA